MKIKIPTQTFTDTDNLWHPSNGQCITKLYYSIWYKKVQIMHSFWNSQPPLFSSCKILLDYNDYCYNEFMDITRTFLSHHCYSDIPIMTNKFWQPHYSSYDRVGWYITYLKLTMTTDNWISFNLSIFMGLWPVNFLHDT